MNIDNVEYRTIGDFIRTTECEINDFVESTKNLALKYVSVEELGMEPGGVLEW